MLSILFCVFFKELSEQKKNAENDQKANLKLLPPNEFPLISNNSFK